MLTCTAGLALGAAVAKAPPPGPPPGLQQPAPARWSRLAEPVFHTIGRSHGLPNDVVYSVGQDAAGFLWIGTVSGLARWDGHSARIYSPGPPAAGQLPDGWIQALQRDADGRLWVGTSGGGIARYDAQRDRFDTLGAGPQGLSHVNVHVLLDDGAGQLWVGTDGGLDRVDPRSLKATPQAAAGAALSGLPAMRVLALLRDRSGRLWVGGEAGLFRQAAPGAGNTPAFERVRLAGEPQPEVQALHLDSQGRLWIGTVQRGAFVWDAQATEAQPLQLAAGLGQLLHDEHVTSICELSPGVVWLATLGQGVVEVRPGTGPEAGPPLDGRRWDARRLRHAPGWPASLADDTVRSLFRDRSGLLWLATDRGISRHDPTQRAVLTMFGLEADGPPPGPGQPRPRESTEIGWILPTADGRLWLGTQKHGIAIVDPEGGLSQHLRPDADRPTRALPQDIVLSIAEGLAGEKYVATKRGLYRASADGRRIERVELTGRDPAASTWSLWRERSTLWIGGGTDGLWSLDLATGQGRRRSVPATAALGEPPPAPASRAASASVPGAPAPGADWQLSEDRVTVLAPGPEGSLWVGTRNGLHRIDPQRGVLARWLPERDNPRALGGGFITAVHTDRRGRLWVGTFGAGLALVEQPLAARPTVRRIGLAEGLPDNNINALVEDLQGRIWGSTDSGLARVDPDTLAVRALRTADGVMFPIYWTGAAARTARGELLFGGAGGLTIVRPEAVTDWTERPPIVITALQMGGRAVQPAAWMAGQHLTVPAEANGLVLEFAALDYSDPARLRYASRLLGAGGDWVETDAQHRLLAYAHLSPGEYTLQLRATNRQGLWVPEPLQLPLRVLPAWYQTWWARALGVLAALLSVALVLQWRTRRLRAQQALLERRVDERTAQLREVTQRLAEKSLALERKSLALEQASLTDPLTGLHNRRYLSGRLATPAAGEPGFALLLIDIDHFKQINDSHGHAVGDAALVAIAQRLQQLLRPVDDLVRWGGEEFLLVARGLDAAAAATLAERLRCAIQDQPVAAGSAAGVPEGLALTVSIGFACLPFVPGAPQALDWEEALGLADLALYAAKRAARNCWMGLAAGPHAYPVSLVARALANPQASVAHGELRVLCREDNPAQAAALRAALRGH
ncbi:MAG: diguanylate cyclase [Burkholderiales bacterium]|nr:diguanylate cyclase [Burkholderiales bacterium]